MRVPAYTTVAFFMIQKEGKRTSILANKMHLILYLIICVNSKFIRMVIDRLLISSLPMFMTCIANIVQEEFAKMAMIANPAKLEFMKKIKISSIKKGRILDFLLHYNRI